MSGPPVDPRLEPALRDELRRRDPDEAAPPGLRSWVLGVPDDAPQSPAFRTRRELAALLSLAAVLLLVAIGLSTIRHLGLPAVAGPGSSVDSASSPSPEPSPVELFDPTLEGPGISTTDDLSPAILVVAACSALALLAATARGWRRAVPAIVGVLLAAWALVGSLAPVAVTFSGYGPGLNVIQAPRVPGSSEELLYEVAPAGGRFSVGILLNASQPLPIRIEGIVSATYAGRDRYLGVVLTAVWVDGEPHGGMTGPTRPFAPLDVPPEGRAIWLVGRAGGCALGSAFDPSDADAVGFQGFDDLDLRVSVLGWPRTIHVALPFRLVEPEPPSCPVPTPQPSSR